ncbi:hypothetical protein BCD49_03240 [Pseudofrankia sp. EUN1h]|nr:hypothetical protein BCD49_03240 [Pseudofrankia sp. EUN1h]
MPRPREAADTVTTATTTGGVPGPPEGSPKPSEPVVPVAASVPAGVPKPVEGLKPPERAVRRDGDESPLRAAPGGGSVGPVWPTAVSTGYPRPR